jgi:hypothetical protein
MWTESPSSTKPQPNHHTTILIQQMADLQYCKSAVKEDQHLSHSNVLLSNISTTGGTEYYRTQHQQIQSAYQHSCQINQHTSGPQYPIYFPPLSHQQECDARNAYGYGPGIWGYLDKHPQNNLTPALNPGHKSSQNFATDITGNERLTHK